MPPVYHTPQNFSPAPMGMAAPAIGFGGQCFAYGQMGHMSKNCQNSKNNIRMGGVRPQNQAPRKFNDNKNFFGKKPRKGG